MTPNFDRNGNEIKGVKYFLGLVLGLGGEGAKGVLVRWAIAALFVVGAKRYFDTGRLPAYLR